MPIEIEHPDGKVSIDDSANGRRRVSVELPDGRRFGCETSYSPEVLEEILNVKGPYWMWDEIQREEDPHYVERYLTNCLLSYIDDADFAGKRLLDLGCGSGSSSLVLRRIFPETEIVGVELVPEFVNLARMRAEFHGAPLRFEQSPDGASLPEGLGEFDFVSFSAVYEHLLPDERGTLLPRVWSHLRPGGVLFINQLPNRWSPVEVHTTGLPLINYLPDRATHAASRLSKRLSKDESWEQLLRMGIRGGSPRQIISILNSTSSRAILLEPNRLGFRDRIDLWAAMSISSRWPVLKRALKGAFKLVKWTTRATIVPDLSLAFRKADESPSPSPTG